MEHMPCAWPCVNLPWKKITRMCRNAEQHKSGLLAMHITNCTWSGILIRYLDAMLASCTDTVDKDDAIRSSVDSEREYTNKIFVPQCMHTSAVHLTLDSVHSCMPILSRGLSATCCSRSRHDDDIQGGHIGSGSGYLPGTCIYLLL